MADQNDQNMLIVHRFLAERPAAVLTSAQVAAVARQSCSPALPPLASTSTSTLAGPVDHQLHAFSLHLFQDSEGWVRPKQRPPGSSCQQSVQLLMSAEATSHAETSCPSGSPHYLPFASDILPTWPVRDWAMRGLPQESLLAEPFSALLASPPADFLPHYSTQSVPPWHAERLWCVSSKSQACFANDARNLSPDISLSPPPPLLCPLLPHVRGRWILPLARPTALDAWRRLQARVDDLGPQCALHLCVSYSQLIRKARDAFETGCEPL